MTPGERRPRGSAAWCRGTRSSPANDRKEAPMRYMVTRRQTALVIPTNSQAYFAAAGFFALAGLLLWAAEQD